MRIEKKKKILVCVHAFVSVFITKRLKLCMTYSLSAMRTHSYHAVERLVVRVLTTNLYIQSINQSLHI
jgi:ABC-type microcin C transport system permease subunit YejB